MKKLLIVSLVLFAPSALLAQDEHGHSDIEFEYHDGKIEILVDEHDEHEEEEEHEEHEGAPVFEGEFGEGAFANFASEPGIASEIEEGGGINPGNIIGFDVVKRLYYWDGSQAGQPGDATITIAGAGGAPDTVISYSSGLQPVSFADPLMNLLGQADGAGDFHVDPGYTVSDGAPAGGYGLVLSLQSDDASGIEQSDPFGIFLNLGLEEAAFEAGVESFASFVPEPSSLSILAVALLGIGCVRRKR